MIKGISTSESQWLNIYTSGGSYIYGNPSNGIDGQVRLNATTQQYEAFANGTWHVIGGVANVDPSQRMIEILQWAESKMHMEQEVMKLIADNPTVSDSYNNYKEAESKLKMVMTLVKESQ